MHYSHRRRPLWKMHAIPIIYGGEFMCEVEGKIQNVNISLLPAPVLKFIAPYFADFLLFLHTHFKKFFTIHLVY